jgi:curved DNA-binding protein CbpA
LGLSSKANAEDIKKSYRKLAMLYHPDVNPNPDAQASFQLINEAYQVLSNPELKFRYDNRQAYQQYKKQTQPGHKQAARRASRQRREQQQPPPRAHYKARQKPVENDDFRVLESIMFYSILAIGGLAIVMSIVDLFYKKVNALNGVLGIGACLSFLFLCWYKAGFRKIKE